MILYPMFGDERVVLFDPFRSCSADKPIIAHLFDGGYEEPYFNHTLCGRPRNWTVTTLPWRLVAGTTLVKVCDNCRRAGARRKAEA